MTVPVNRSRPNSEGKGRHDRCLRPSSRFAKMANPPSGAPPWFGWNNHTVQALWQARPVPCRCRGFLEQDHWCPPPKRPRAAPSGRPKSSGCLPRTSAASPNCCSIRCRPVRSRMTGPFRAGALNAGHVREGFSCGVAALDRYFLRQDYSRPPPSPLGTISNDLRRARKPLLQGAH